MSDNEQSNTQFTTIRFFWKGRRGVDSRRNVFELEAILQGTINPQTYEFLKLTTTFDLPQQVTELQPIGSCKLEPSRGINFPVTLSGLRYKGTEIGEPCGDHIYDSYTRTRYRSAVSAYPFTQSIKFPKAVTFKLGEHYAIELDKAEGDSTTHVNIQRQDQNTGEWHSYFGSTPPILKPSLCYVLSLSSSGNKFSCTESEQSPNRFFAKNPNQTPIKTTELPKFIRQALACQTTSDTLAILAPIKTHRTPLIEEKNAAEEHRTFNIKFMDGSKPASPAELYQRVNKLECQAKKGRELAALLRFFQLYFLYQTYNNRGLLDFMLIAPLLIKGFDVLIEQLGLPSIQERQPARR